MELHQLEYVVALDKYKQFSLASEKINISQPSMSYGIKALEQELGVVLFARTTRSLQLTEAGKEFLIYASNILTEVQNVKNAMQNHQKLYIGNIRLGSIPSISCWDIISVIISFQKVHPGIHVDINEENSDTLIKKIVSSELDMAFLSLAEPLNEQTACIPIGYDHLVLLVHRSHWLANHRQITHLSDLAEEKFLVVTGLKKDFTAHCRLTGFEPYIAFTSNHKDSVKKHVEENVGIAPFTATVAKEMQNDQTVIVEFTPFIKRTLVLAMAKKNNSLIIKVFKEFFLEHFTNKSLREDE
jgi:DNA-binding transcriptional LysR family regulator